MTTAFAGTYTALVTPFTADGADTDFTTLKALVEEQVAAGIDGLVAVGTTGESPTLDFPEHQAVVEAVIAAAAGRTKVIAGTGGNATSEAVRLTREADQAGADAMLQVAPYYNKPSQEGLYRHFATVAEATSKPILLYSIPGRCGVEIGIETVARLHRDYPHISTIKEAGGKSDRVSALRDACGESLTILSGDDSLTLPFMSVGAEGVISVASNLLPGAVRAMVEAARANDFVGAREHHARLFPLFADFLRLDTNPVPIKAAMALCGKLPNAIVRPPLVGLGEAGTTQLRERLQALDLLSA